MFILSIWIWKTATTKFENGLTHFFHWLPQREECLEPFESITLKLSEDDYAWLHKMSYRGKIMTFYCWRYFNVSPAAMFSLLIDGKASHLDWIWLNVWTNKAKYTYIQTYFIKQNNQLGVTSFDCFGRVREIGPPFSAEASCQVDAIPGQNEAFTFDLTNVER